MTPPTPPIRVVTMIDSLLAGGAERVAVELACALDRERFAPHVLVTRGSGPLESLLRAADVPFTMLERTRRIEPLAWRRAHRLVREHDLIHAHKFGSNIWGALLARTARVPLVAHEHNFAAEASRARALADRRWIVPAADRIICVSESVADVERAIGVPEEQLLVVPNGVRVDAAWPRARARDELGLAHDAWVVGIVGRLRPEKGHEVALRAVARLAGTGRTPTLCVVGDGPRMAELRALAGELGVAAHVHWAGEHDDAARLAGAFDAGLVCSHWEGMPLAALETMAAGVPLVATAVGALPELVADGRGVCVSVADDAAVAGAIAALMDDPAHAHALGDAGAARVRDEYSFERMVRTVEQVYLDVVARSAHASSTRTRSSGDTDSTGEVAA